MNTIIKNVKLGTFLPSCTPAHTRSHTSARHLALTDATCTFPHTYSHTTATTTMAMTRPFNSFRKPNSTNLHTHGLHESPTAPADTVLVEIEPGGSRTYQYSIVNNHMPGTFWYHPHYHGSSALQVGGGKYARRLQRAVGCRFNGTAARPDGRRTDHLCTMARFRHGASLRSLNCQHTAAR